MVELGPVTVAACAELVDNLRDADRQELAAAYALDLDDVIVNSVARSTEAFAAWDSYGRLVAIFGCAPFGPILTPMASPWLLGTPLLEKHAGALVRLSRRYVAAWQEQHPLLVNFVDVRNTASIRYLRAVGFKFDAPAPFGISGLPFHRFTMGFE